MATPTNQPRTERLATLGTAHLTPRLGAAGKLLELDPSGDIAPELPVWEW